ncbi:MAG: sigma-70 family RNA polymerase sigma factor [Thermoguttaceae bacterium]
MTTDPGSSFADCLVAVQRGLYAYILTLAPWPDEASDILQQTNLVLWRDAARFEPGTDFRAWAYRVAYFQVLAQRRKAGRDRLRFNDELLKDLAANMLREPESVEEEADALVDCLRKLPKADRLLISRRYESGVSVKSLAGDMQVTSNTLAVRLHRIRKALLDCTQETIAEPKSR